MGKVPSLFRLPAICHYLDILAVPWPSKDKLLPYCHNPKNELILKVTFMYTNSINYVQKQYLFSQTEKERDGKKRAHFYVSYKISPNQQKHCPKHNSSFYLFNPKNFLGRRKAIASSILVYLAFALCKKYDHTNWA